MKIAYLLREPADHTVPAYPDGPPDAEPAPLAPGTPSPPLPKVDPCWVCFLKLLTSVKEGQRGGQPWKSNRCSNISLSAIKLRQPLCDM